MEDLKEVQPEYADTGLKQPVRTQEVLGKFFTVSTVPTKAPRNWNEQIQIYVSGGTYRLYIYDTSANTWHYVDLT